MSGWEELLSTAMVGTERRSFPLDGLDALGGDPNDSTTSDTTSNTSDATSDTANTTTGDTADDTADDTNGETAQASDTSDSTSGSISDTTNTTTSGSISGAIDAPEAEAAVLAAAAVLAGYRRAGWTPAPWQGALPAAAAPDERPECSAAAAQVLELLLDRTVRIEGGTDMLVGHWLAACVAAGQRVPARLVVGLLRFGTAATGLRDAVRDVTGPRGAWLATHNPQWTWAAVPPANEITERFATATRADRIALLTSVRRTDPALGRALVEDTWSTEQATTRAGLLDALAVELGDDDEPFLEQALDDRATTVRAAAAALLDRLPASRRAARMAERATASVRLTRRRLDVELPDTLDATARRDGITDRREPGHGTHASWLIQILAATPLSTWNVAPDDAVRLAAEHPQLRIGWAKAALRQRDQAWLATLARHSPAPELLAALTPAAATEIVSGIAKVDARFGGLLAACPGPWPVAFAVDLVGRLRAAAADNVLTLAAPTLAAELDPGALPAVEAWLEATDTARGSTRRTLRGLAHALTLRSTITQEFP